MTTPEPDRLDPGQYRRGSFAWMFARESARRIALDITDPDERAAALAQLDQDHPPLGTVTHHRRNPR